MVCNPVKPVDGPAPRATDGGTAMQQGQPIPIAPSVQLPLMLVADLQDSLLVFEHDLSRLDSLLAHTIENLM